MTDIKELVDDMFNDFEVVYKIYLEQRNHQDSPLNRSAFYVAVMDKVIKMPSGLPLTDAIIIVRLTSLIEYWTNEYKKELLIKTRKEILLFKEIKMETLLIHKVTPILKVEPQLLIDSVLCREDLSGHAFGRIMVSKSIYKVTCPKCKKLWSEGIYE